MASRRAATDTPNADLHGNVAHRAPTVLLLVDVINDMEWGSDNLFDANIAVVNGDGFGFYIHDPETSNNSVLCNNEVTEAGSGFANLECT